MPWPNSCIEEKIECRLSVVVLRRQPDVVHARPRGERVDGLVEPPRVGGEAEVLEDLALDALLRVDREVAGQERVVDGVRTLGDLGDERDEALLQLVEHRAHLGRLHARLVVVEEEVVVLVGGLEALDVLPAQLDHLLEVRLEHRPVGRPCEPPPRPGSAIAAVRDISAESSGGTRTSLS